MSYCENCSPCHPGTGRWWYLLSFLQYSRNWSTALCSQSCVLIEETLRGLTCPKTIQMHNNWWGQGSILNREDTKAPERLTDLWLRWRPGSSMSWWVVETSLPLLSLIFLLLHRKRNLSDHSSINSQLMSIKFCCAKHYSGKFAEFPGPTLGHSDL